MSVRKAGNQISTILVGVDGSDTSEAALLWASELSTSIGAKLHVLSTWETPFPAAELMYGSFDWDISEINERPAKIARYHLDKVLHDVFGNAHPDGVIHSVEEGDPRIILVEQSKKYDLLVLGSRGHTQVVETILGSVSQYCLTHAHSPVVVVK